MDPQQNNSNSTGNNSPDNTPDNTLQENGSGVSGVPEQMNYDQERSQSPGIWRQPSRTAETPEVSDTSETPLERTAEQPPYRVPDEAHETQRFDYVSAPQQSPQGSPQGSPQEEYGADYGAYGTYGAGYGGSQGPDGYIRPQDAPRSPRESYGEYGDHESYPLGGPNRKAMEGNRRTVIAAVSVLVVLLVVIAALFLTGVVGPKKSAASASKVATYSVNKESGTRSESSGSVKDGVSKGTARDDRMLEKQSDGSGADLNLDKITGLD